MASGRCPRLHSTVPRPSRPVTHLLPPGGGLVGTLGCACTNSPSAVRAPQDAVEFGRPGILAPLMRGRRTALTAAPRSKGVGEPRVVGDSLVLGQLDHQTVHRHVLEQQVWGLHHDGRRQVDVQIHPRRKVRECGHRGVHSSQLQPNRRIDQNGLVEPLLRRPA